MSVSQLKLMADRLAAGAEKPAKKKKQVKPKKPTTKEPEIIEEDSSNPAFLGYEKAALSLTEPSEVSITQSNELVSASYRLSLDAKRLLLIAISKMNPQKPLDVGRDENGNAYIKTKQILVSAEEWLHFYGGNKDKVYQRLKTAMSDLYESSAIIFRDDVSGRECRWIDEKYYHDGEGVVEIQLTSRVTAHLSCLFETFTTYKVMNIGGLRSLHSIRIYELIAQFKSTGFRKILIEDLRKALGLTESSYPKFNDFRRRVIEHSVKEINEKTDFKVTYSLEKKGRKIHAINFFLSANLQQQLEL